MGAPHWGSFSTIQAARRWAPSVLHRRLAACEGAKPPSNPPFFGFAMKLDPKNPPKYTCWLPAVRLTKHQLERIRELYGPERLSDGIRRRLLKKRAVGRPRRTIHQADPELLIHLAEISATLQEIKRFHQNLSIELELDFASIISLTLLAELHEKLNTIIHYHEKQD